MTNIEEIAKRIDDLESTIAGLKVELKRLHKDETIQTPITTKESKLSHTERAKIDDVLRDFNFKRVHDVMEYLNWVWAMSNNGVPTEDEIRDEAKRLLIDAALEKTCVATGGLRAVYEKEYPEDDDPYIGLEFIVEECEGFADDDDADEDEDEYPAPWARYGAIE